ncbi:hypothetical protein GQ600_11191 [Phytophthora cactorum]|nr:hypothetical protein GQ600_11191 [Phytophthora cactorum]
MDKLAFIRLDANSTRANPHLSDGHPLDVEFLNVGRLDHHLDALLALEKGAEHGSACHVLAPELRTFGSER